MKKVFLTGSTGVLGKALLTKLLVYPDVKVIVLLRKENEEIKKIKDENPQRLDIVYGDICQKDMALAKQQVLELLNDIDVFIHAAALTDFRATEEEHQRINVLGTKNVLDFVMEIKAKSFFHVSTVYVCGDFKGLWKENYLDQGQGFKNAYEESKFQAELLLRAKQQDSTFKADVIRLGQIVDRKNIHQGDPRYYILRLFLRKLYKRIPMEKESLLNISELEELSDLLAEFFINVPSSGQTLHILKPMYLSFKKLFSYLQARYHLEMPEMVVENKFNWQSLSYAKTNLILPFVKYWNHGQIRFDLEASRKYVSEKLGKEYDFLKDCDEGKSLKYLENLLDSIEESK